MVKKIFFNQKILWPVLLIVIMGIIAPLSFFEKDKIIVGLDEWSVLRPSFRLKDWSSTWGGFSSLGRDLSSRIVNVPLLVFPFFLMEKVGLSLINSQKIFFSFIFVLSGLSMYFLAITLWERKHFLALIASIVYMFNPVTGGYWDSLLVPAIFCIAISPLLLALFIKGLKFDNKLYYSILFSLSTVFYPMVSPPMFAILCFLFLAFWVYFSVKDRKIKRNTIYAILCIVFFVLFNFWWISNTTRSFLGNPDFMESGDSFSRLATSSMKSSFLNLFRFQTNYWGFSYWGDNISDYTGYLLETNPFMVAGSFLITVLAFSSIILIKKSLLIRYLSFVSLIFIFLSKGIHAPFGFVYAKLFQLPLFNMFRTPAHKFPVATILIFSLLIGSVIDEIWCRLKTKRRGTRFLVVGIIVFLILANGWYFFTGDVLQRGKAAPPPVQVKFPDYYWLAGDWLKGQKDYFRIFTLPGSDIPTNWTIYKWGFLGLYAVPSEIYERPVVDKLPRDSFESFRRQAYGLLGNFKGLPLDYRSLPKTKNISKLLSLMTVKYLLVNRDIDWQHQYYGTEDPKLLSKVISNQKEMKLEKTFGSLDFYKVSNSLPHIFTSSSTQQIIGDNFALALLADFPEWFPEKGSFEGNSFLANKIFVIPSPENKVSSRDLAAFRNSTSIDFPFSRWSPGSVIYSAVINKEVKQVQSAVNWQQEFGLKLSLSNKRIYEIQKWGATLSEEVFKKTIENYRDKMTSAKNLFEEHYPFENSKELISQYEAYLESQEERLLEVAKSLDGYKKEMVYEALDELFDGSESKIYKNNFFISKYNIDIKEKGSYDVYLRKDDALPAESHILLITKEETKTFENRPEGEWISLGRKEYQAGKNNLSLEFSPTENLIDSQKRKTRFDSTAYLCQQITSYSNSLYQIKFDYKLKPDRQKILVIEENNSEKNIINFQKILRGGGEKFRHYEGIFRSGPFVEKIYFCNQTNDNENEIIFSNLEVRKIFEPVLVLSLQKKSENLISPMIQFQRISSGEYKVKVEEAKDPYILIFSETYSKDWQASIGNKIITENKHLVINGYANSWLVKPDDSNKQEKYEILLRYQPQRLLFISVIVSIISIMGGLIYLVAFKLSKHHA